jgi:8-oxo-dGTP pyrophosphatase MutT (NUDIX family)
MSLLDRIRECNSYDLSKFRPFRVGEAQVGWIRHAFAGRLADFPKVFAIGKEDVALLPALDSYEARSEAMATVVEALVEKGDVPALRHELYGAAPGFEREPLFALDRTAVSYFGIGARGLHLNGYVRSDGGLKMWIGRRAEHRQNYPGMLDQMVAGGQPLGLTIAENLKKEAHEEASIPDDLIKQAMPVGAITYCCEGEGGLKPDVQYCFDLELPADFEPKNRDGEIAEFELWSIDRVAEVVATSQRFKFNCNLVIIDFLVRHGQIVPDDADYLAIVRGLRQ